MDSSTTPRKHEVIQQAILSSCQQLGVRAIPEYRGGDWRADVFIPDDQRPIAFEVQLSPQSLKKTLDRQTKYNRDGITGCWLFEKPVPKLYERQSLPLFYVEEDASFKLQVNLYDRRKVHLADFLDNFVSNNIQFKSIAKTKIKQTVRLVFYKFKCWKCLKMNHLYYVDTPFYSSCNAIIQPSEALWASNTMEHRPEIVHVAQAYVKNNLDLQLNLGKIKERHTHTVGHPYMSFGCYNCDSIFGAWYVNDAKLEMMYASKEIVCEQEIELNEMIEMPIEHWCFPEDGQFCDNH